MLESLVYPAPSDCVFIHGAGGNSLLWSRTLRRLSGARRAFAVDLPGHPTGSITCTSIPAYADSVLGFISDGSLGRVSLCGHSMGAAVALTLAIEHPEAVDRLVLVGGGAKLGVSPSILEGLAGQPLKAIEKIITPMSFHHVTLEAGREARKALSLSNPEVFLNDYRACDGFDVRARLKEVRARTLVVCGESDRMTPPRYSEFLRANIPNSSLSVIKGAGHMVPLERPEALATLVQSFLSDLNL